MNVRAGHTGRTVDTVIDSGRFYMLSNEDRPCFVDNLAAVIRRGGTYFMLCFSELKYGYGSRQVTQAEIKDLFQMGGTLIK